MAVFYFARRARKLRYYAPINVTPHPPLYGDRWGIGGDLTHRMCQIPHPSITIQCQIPTLYILTRICAGTRANACAGQKPHPWGVISWRIPTKPHPYPLQGGVGRNIDRRIIWRCYTLIRLEISRRTRWWCLKCVEVFLALDIPPFVMYCVNGKPRSSLFIESTDSMIIYL